MRKVKIFSVFMSIILLCSTLLPSVSVSAAFTPKFALHSEGVYMVNLDTDIVIVSKNADKKLTPASTTKIMTAYIIVRNANLDDMVTVNAEAVDQPSDSSVAHLKEGDVISVRDLLYGLMLPSGNDAAIMLADYYSGR